MALRCRRDRNSGQSRTLENNNDEQRRRRVKKIAQRVSAGKGYANDDERQRRGTQGFHKALSAVDEPLFRELGRLTRAGYDKFMNLKFL